MDSSAIEGLKAEAVATVVETFDKFFTIMTELSSRNDDIAAWTGQFFKEIGQKCDELLSDIENLRREIAEKVDEAVITVKGLCARLHLEAPKVDSNKSLYEKLAQLEEWITGYNEQITVRMSEINVLIEQEKSLCLYLGRRPKLIETDPLPYQAHLDEFKEHLRKLESEKAIRLQKKKELDDLVLLLDYSPQTEFERHVCCKDFFPIDEVINEFDSFYDTLMKKVSALKEEVHNLRSEINELWNLLCIDLLEQESLRKSTEGCDWKTLKVLKAEKKRCMELKMANIERFVTCLRGDLEKMWKKCYCPKTIKEEFKFFNTDWFDEKLLQIHETELKKWTEFYVENKELMKLIEIHGELWKNMSKLEENAINPDRFKNRGGQLLKEEKERKALAKKIPQIEEEIRLRAKDFKLRTGREFTIFGIPIEEYFGNLYADRENLKIQKLSSRKQKLTPGKPLANCALKLTPACKRKLLSPAQTPADDKIASDVNTQYTDVGILNVPEPEKKQVCVTPPKWKRLSIERNKRLQKLRKHLRPTMKDGDIEIFCSTPVESPSKNLHELMGESPEKRSLEV